MPLVPRYTQQVQPSNMPNARVSTDAPSLEAFGGGQSAQALNQASMGLQDRTQKLIAEEKNKADQIIFMTSDKALSEAETSLQIATSKMRGKDAFGASTFVKEEWDKKVEEVAGGLNNEDQRMAVMKSANSRWMSLNRNVEGHVANQAKNLDDDTTNGYLQNAKNSAALNAHDDSRIGLEVERTQAAVTEWATRNGVMNTDFYKAKLTNELSGVHSAVIGARLNADQDQSAKAYFDANKENMNEKDLDQVGRALEIGSIRGESQRFTDEITGKVKTMTEALAATKDLDPKLRDATESRIREHYNLQKVARREDQEKTTMDAANMLLKTEGKSPVPDQIMAKLDLPERAALERYRESLRAGEPIVTDWAKYYELGTIGSNPSTKDKFLQTNLILHRNHLADKEFNDLFDMQKALRKGDTKAIDGFRSDMSIVNDTLSSVGIDPTPKPGSDESALVSKFRRMADEQFMDIERRTGKKGTNEELQRIVTNLTAKGITEKGWFWDTKKRAFEVEPGETFELDIKEIPRGERAKIETQLKSRGMPITDQSIMKLYGNKIQGIIKHGG